MIRGDKPITRDQAIEFCQDRQKMHKLGAEKIAAENDINNDGIALAKYKAIVDLSNIYGDIATMLVKG